MNISFTWYISLLWFFLSILSLFISIMIRLGERTIDNDPAKNKLPKWAIHLLKNSHDPYFVFFRIGGIVLAILSIPVGFVSNQTELDIAIWASIIGYFSIPSFFIRRWHL